MLLSEQEKKNLKIDMLLRGFSSYETDFFGSSSYKKLRETMLNNLPGGNLSRFKFILFPKSEVLKDGKFVIEKHFNKCDLRVFHTNGDDMRTQLAAIFGKQPNPEQSEEIIEYIKNKIELVRVTDVPVYLSVMDESNGYVNDDIFYGCSIMNDDYYEKLPSCIAEIGLSGDCNENSKCTYVHEMAHALINRHKGAVSNLLNDEVFSIFMEKVAAMDIEQSGRLLELRTIYRILETKQNMLDKENKKFNEVDFFGLLSCRKYIISSLYATALFDTYFKGSNKLRSEIDAALGEVISGNAVLEDIFERYEANLDKGSRIMRKQIKMYDKKYVGR